jgi:hypothetical protein
MQKNEYKLVRVDFDDQAHTIENNENQLNGFGQDGWELVEIIPLHVGKLASRFAYCLKRPID